METEKLPNVVYVVRGANGKLSVFEHLKDCPVYYDEDKGILVGEFVLERTGTLKKEIRYTNTVEQ